MSFRVRVLSLVFGIALTSTAATAWLTLRLANRQVIETAAAKQQDIALITARLAEYGRNHNTWVRVEPLLTELATETGQRIRVATESGVPVADSDVLAGRAARPDGPLTALVDPRPVVRVPVELRYQDTVPLSLVKILSSEVADYQVTQQFAECLTRSGARVVARTTGTGIPTVDPVDADQPGLVDCKRQIDGLDRGAITETLSRCLAPPDRDYLQCLQRTFSELINFYAPEPVRVFIGARDETAAPLDLGPVAAVAGGVALFAIAGGLLFSRRVLGPIGALTRASRRVAAGDFGSRVPAAGHDELARLGQAFNRMASNLQRAEERQRRLVADVAHELRTPLANLRGYLEALKDGVVPPSPELFASLHDEALLQQRIVADLQDLALAEAGTLAYHRTRLDLAELVETCRTAHRARAEAAGVTLTAETLAPADLDGDPDRLRQVVGNLVTNAIRATPPGGTVSLTAWPAGGAATIVVADTGTGIPADDLPHVFDRFWRADTARGRTTGGAGLGLAIARQIVTDHGGTITAASTEGRGARFTVTLPGS